MAKEVNHELRKLKRKFLITMIAGILLLSAVFYYAYGWYTKNSSMSDVTFNVAEWEFTASKQTDDTKVQAYTYDTIEKELVAPGAWGHLDYKLSNNGSATDTTYVLTFDKSKMLDEFQKRMYFYYENQNGQGDFSGDYSKLTLLNGSNQITGSITKGADIIVHAYWHWIYDYAEYLTYDTNATDFLKDCGASVNGLDNDAAKNICSLFEDLAGKGATSADKIKEIVGEENYLNNKDAYDFIAGNYSSMNSKYSANVQAFDEFDADVGKHPEAYAEYMKAVVTAVGAEAKPLNGN